MSIYANHSFKVLWLLSFIFISACNPISETKVEEAFSPGSNDEIEIDNIPSELTSSIIGSGPVIADGLSQSIITITLLNIDSNPVENVTPSFTATDTGFSNNYGACSATNASGVSTCTLTSTISEIKTLSLTSPINLVGGTVQFDSPAISSVNSTITGTSSILADGVATSTVTITLLDTISNPVEGITPTFAATGATNNYATCSATNASGLSTCTFTSTTAETKTLSITSPITKAGGTVTFIAGSAAVANSTITGTSSIIANGVATSTVTITLLDASSNPIAGSTPTFSATDTGGTNNYAACSATNASGVSTCTFTSTRAETKTLSITAPIIKAGGTVTFIAGAAAVATSTITGTSSITANGVATSTVTITLLDASSNPVASITPTFSATDTGGTNNYSACTATNASGVSTCTFTSTTAETKTLSITSPITKAGGTVTFIAGSAAVATSTITGTSSITANGVATSTVTITLLDTLSNPVEGITPTFSATDTGGTNNYAACSVTNASGVSTCTFTSTKAETKTLSITAPITKADGTVTFIAGSAVVANSSITASTPHSADGSDTSTITITLIDNFSNPLVGVIPTPSVSGTNNTLSACSAANASGVSTCTLSTTTPEVKTISLASPVLNTTSTFTFDPPVANDLTPDMIMENTEEIITLEYTDTENDLATSCTISNLSNVTISQACTCTTGTCTVGITGSTDYRGLASFNYIVTANGQDSNLATVNLSINPYLLNQYPHAGAAYYSLRKLRSEYAGPAIRVRRSSDNTEQDISFTATGYLDTDTLSTFCAATNCFVRTWHDQGLTAAHATQTTQSRQPQIVSGGTVLLQNLKPTVYFDGNTRWLSTSYSYVQNSISMFVSYRRLGSHTNIWNNFTTVIGGGTGINGCGSTWCIYYNDSPNMAMQVRADNGGSPAAYGTSIARNDNFNIHTAIGISGDSIYYQINDSDSNQRDISDLTPATTAGTFRFGTNASGTTMFFNGNLSEVIFYNNNQTDNKDEIIERINDYFNVY